MQVRQDNQIDVLGRKAFRFETLNDRVTGIRAEQSPLLVVQLSAVTRVNEDVLPACLHEDAVRGLRDAVEFVDGDQLGPHDLGNDAEHRSAVGTKSPAGDGAESELAEFHGDGSGGFGLFQSEFFDHDFPHAEFLQLSRDGLRELPHDADVPGHFIVGQALFAKGT